MQKYKLQEVFVPVGFPENTYVIREDLEIRINAAKINRGKHILIYGPSKSGKSNLWRKYFKKDERVKIPISSTKTIDDIYAEILNELEAFYTSESSESSSLKASFLSEVKSSLASFFSARVQASVEATQREEERRVPVAQNVIAPNLVIKYLKPTNKTVILEDFHYANEQLKKQLSQDLKAFSDEECQFVMISVQHKNTDLVIYNQDLQHRISNIMVGFFNSTELELIINTGCNLLSIEFNEDLKIAIINESMQSAAITQDICQKICLFINVAETLRDRIIIEDIALMEKSCIYIAEDNKSFYETLVKNIAAGGRSNGSTEKYKWFLKMIQRCNIPETGLLNTQVLQLLRDLGHDSIDQTSVTQGLKYLPKLLERRGLPPVFDYDEDHKTMYLLDKYMKFVFRWKPCLIEGLF